MDILTFFGSSGNAEAAAVGGADAIVVVEVDAVDAVDVGVKADAKLVDDAAAAFKEYCPAVTTAP